MIEEHENQETSLQDLIDLVERDDLPTNEFTIQDKDPMVILGKLNEVIAYLQTLQATINASDSKANEALQKAIQAVADATQALSVANGIDGKATQALANAIEAVSTANTALSESNTALSTANTAISTANTALSSANSAVETAENALGTAERAETKADTAITTANGAKTTAEGIDAKATTALANSQTAISTANTAETKAQEALDQVVTGLGTKVYRDTQLLTTLDIKPIEDDIADNTTAITALQNGKVDKVTGKQLSTEDFTTTEKNKLAGLNNYDDTQVQADITALQNGKVDKVAGKQLSTEDYTTAEKTKLAGLSNYDDTQVQADLSSLQANDLALGNRIGTAETNITNLQNVKEQALAKEPNYIKYKSGLTIQTGTLTTTGASSYYITLPIAMPSAEYIVLTSVVNYKASKITLSSHLVSQNETHFTICLTYNTSTANYSKDAIYRWVAICLGV